MLTTNSTDSQAMAYGSCWRCETVASLQNGECWNCTEGQIIHAPPNPFLNHDGIELSATVGDRINKASHFNLPQVRRALILHEKYRFLQQAVVIHLRKRLKQLEPSK